MILERIEPVAKQTDDSAVLEALGDDDDSELPARVDQSKAWASSGDTIPNSEKISMVSPELWRLPARPCLQVPLDCGQGGRAGSWCLGPRNVCTRPGMVGFPVRRGPPGRSEERNGRQGGSACRWPQVFHTQAIRLRPMTLFNPVFNCLTPIAIKRSKTQADEGLALPDLTLHLSLSPCRPLVNPPIED